MDSELIILSIAVIGFIWYYKDKMPANPVPRIGDNLGSALIGPSVEVNKEAIQTASYFQNKKTGESNPPSSTKANDYIIPTNIMSSGPVIPFGGWGRYQKGHYQI